MTSALALLSLRGEVLAIVSKRNFSRDTIIRYLERVGEPLIFAVDRKRPSRSVLRIASSFNALLVAPEKDLTIREKKMLLRKMDLRLDTHEKDALAAALHTFKTKADLFKKIESRLRKRGLSHLEDEVKAKIIRKETHNIDKAIEESSIL